MYLLWSVITWREDRRYDKSYWGILLLSGSTRYLINIIKIIIIIIIINDTDIPDSPSNWTPSLGRAKFRLFFSPKRRNMFCKELLAHCKGSLIVDCILFYSTNLVSFQKSNILYFITFGLRHLHNKCNKIQLHNFQTNIGKLEKTRY